MEGIESHALSIFRQFELKLWENSSLKFENSQNIQILIGGLLRPTETINPNRNY